jgi:hypothetical protein
MSTKRKAPRPNKLYFEAVDFAPTDGSTKPGAGKTRYMWFLKSANGKILGASHTSFASKQSMIKNCISVFNSNLVEATRITIVDPEMRKKVIEEAYKVLDHN